MTSRGRACPLLCCCAGQGHEIDLLLLLPLPLDTDTDDRSTGDRPIGCIRWVRPM